LVLVSTFCCCAAANQPFAKSDCAYNKLANFLELLSRPKDGVLVENLTQSKNHCLSTMLEQKAKQPLWELIKFCLWWCCCCTCSTGLVLVAVEEVDER
jgi:hypothetical protein